MKYEYENEIIVSTKTNLSALEKLDKIKSLKHLRLYGCEWDDCEQLKSIRKIYTPDAV